MPTRFFGLFLRSRSPSSGGDASTPGERRRPAQSRTTHFPTPNSIKRPDRDSRPFPARNCLRVLSDGRWCSADKASRLPAYQPPCLDAGPWGVVAGVGRVGAAYNHSVRVARDGVGCAGRPARRFRPKQHIPKQHIPKQHIPRQRLPGQRGCAAADRRHRRCAASAAAAGPTARPSCHEGGDDGAAGSGVSCDNRRRRRHPRGGRARRGGSRQGAG